MTSLLAWMSNNAAIVLGLVVLGSRIWSHFEHRAGQRQSAKNALGIAEVHILMNSRMSELIKASKEAAHAEGREEGRDEAG